MSLDHYHFHMVLRQEQMTRAERAAADQQAARIAHGLTRLASAVAGTLRRTEGRRPATTLLPRRNP
jgi:hypothetical protein